MSNVEGVECGKWERMYPDMGNVGNLWECGGGVDSVEGVRNEPNEANERTNEALRLRMNL